MVSYGNLRANTEAIIRSQRLETDKRAMLITQSRKMFSYAAWHRSLAVPRIASLTIAAWPRMSASSIRIASKEASKHVLAFAEVIVRNFLSLAPVEAGQQGFVPVCSVLPTSFPGSLLLNEDLAEIIGYDGYPCGRRGTQFRFARRCRKRKCESVATWKQHVTGFAVEQRGMSDRIQVVDSPQEITCAAESSAADAGGF